MKKIKRLISVVLSVSLLFCMIPFATMTASAATTITDSMFAERLADAKSRYKQGEYFAGNDGTYSNLKNTTPNLVCTGTNTIGTTCASAGYCGKGGACSCKCGTYYYGGVARCWQCWAFACQVGYDIFGVDSYSGWNKHKDASQIKAGDIVRFSWSSSYQPHSIFVTSVVGNTVNYADCNATGPCKVNWNNSKSISSIQDLLNNRSDSEFAVYHAPNSNVGTNPESYNYTSITPNVYYLKNVATGKYLSVDGCVDANKTNISVASWENSSGMKYSVTAASDGYSMRPLCSSSRLVNAWGTAPSSGANINLYDNCSESSQWWKFEPVNGGYIIHSAYNSSCVLDTDGSNVSIETRHGGTSQIWVLQTQAEAEAENVVPSKPILYCETIGTSIHAWWDACVNTDRYAIYLHNAETSEIVNKELEITGTEFTFTDVQPGQYFLALASCNNNGYTFGVAKNATVTDISSMDNLVPVDTAVLNGSVYELYNFTADWETVRQWCELQGGHLVTVTSAEEEAVVEELTQSVTSHCWLGASDAENEGEWKWVTGEEFSYSDWYDDEPNNSCSNENYLVINCGASAWNDTLCNSPYANHFILERNISYPDFTTTLLSNNTISITKYTGSASSLEIPEKIDGLPVTAIDSNAFSDCTSLASVTIPEGVTSIGNAAFSGCTSLTSVTIPEGVTSIGNYAFKDCTSLTSVTISEGVTSIGKHTFYNCTSLTSVTIPEGVTSIGWDVFYNCSSLASVTIPSSVTSIGEYAFYNCTSLASVTIPESVTSIGGGAFDCSVTIYGYSGSNAEKYAESNGNVFVAIDTVELTSISINSMPGKATYYIGDSLDTSGLTLKLTYSDGSTETVSSGFETSGFSSETAGTKTVTVSYGGKTTSFTVTVNEPEPDIDENAPQIVLESKKVTKGKEFTVTVTVKNNPRFAYLELTPTYSSELTLVGVENGELISDFSQGNQYIWGADNDVTDDGLLMTFTFTTADSIEPGKYEVGFIVRGCVNYDEQNVDISVVNGEIEILDITYGDLDGDGYVSVKDSKLFIKYLLNTVTDDDINMLNADIDSDGVISTKDSKALMKMLLTE